MKAKLKSPTPVLPIFASVFFVMMTLIFLTVPYAMARHPGEFPSQPKANYGESQQSLPTPVRY